MRCQAKAFDDLVLDPASHFDWRVADLIRGQCNSDHGKLLSLANHNRQLVANVVSIKGTSSRAGANRQLGLNAGVS